MAEEKRDDDLFVERAMSSLPTGRPSPQFRQQLFEQTLKVVNERSYRRRKFRTLATHMVSYAAGLATLFVWQYFGSSPRPDVDSAKGKPDYVANEKKNSKGSDEGGSEDEEAKSLTPPAPRKPSLDRLVKSITREQQIESFKREAERKIRFKGDLAGAAKLFVKAANLCTPEELARYSEGDHWLWTSIRSTKREEALYAKRQ